MEQIIDISSTNRHVNKILEPNGFSIVIPCFNKAEQITKALLSIFKQEYSGPSIEVIIVNDGSTDDFYSKVHLAFSDAPSWIDKIIICDRMGSNEWSSPANSYNSGFNLVSKNYVIHYGADMIFGSNKALDTIYNLCDIDRYLGFHFVNIFEENVNKINKDNIFDIVSQFKITQAWQPILPFIATTSLDALKRVGFYSNDFKKGQWDDNELVAKLKAISVKFYRINDIVMCHQPHEHIAVGGDVHNKNVFYKSIANFKKSIEDGIVKKYEE